jgi:glycosyltransferase involved in cell wall biosynthesis
MPKFLIIGSHPEQLLNFRGDLIRHLQSRGHEVVTASPPGPPEVDQRFASWGVRRINLGMDRTGASILNDLRLLAEIRRLLLAEQPDAVLAYTIKPVIYGALAARLAGRPPMLAMITGLGLAFSKATSFKPWLVRKFARTLYSWAMRFTDVVIFQNPDDEADFRRSRLLRPRHKIERTNGSGVNLQRFPAIPMPAGPMRFLMVSRLLADKGVREYIAAAAVLRQSHPHVECHLVGPFDPNPASLSSGEIDAAVTSNAVVYHGFQRDVRPFLATSHVYVLPSYREGTPRSVLEAMATGRPVITTDAPGCRETVVEGVNGFLVQPGAVEPLVSAMVRMIKMEPTALVAMAEASLQMARRGFDVVAVNAQLTEVLEQASLSAQAGQPTTRTT